MPNVAKLKKKAAEFELKRQFDKALAVYVEILDDFDQHPEEVDVALFNRVGDMLLRQGNVADAVDYYERAVDRYAEGGFFNNAIALCNKILRQSPGRASIYYKLGKISAQKGFKNDAKQNFLEYADRMQKSGRMDEAFRALKEFADLCPDQDDIRLMLAEQLSRQDRAGEAIEQLQTLVERYSQEGRDVEAGATLDRIKAIDPTYMPRPTGPQKAQKSSELVFLDIYAVDEPPPPRPAAAPRREPSASPPAIVPDVPAPAELEITFDIEGSSLGGDLEATGVADAPTDTEADMPNLEPTAFGFGSMDAIPDAAPDSLTLDGLEVTSFGSETAADGPSSDEESEVAAGELDFLVVPAADEASADTPSGLDLEFFMPETGDAGTHGTQRPQASAAPAPALDDDFTLDLGGLEFERDAVVEPGTSASVPEVSIDDALSGLPMMDMEAPAAPMFDDSPDEGLRDIASPATEDMSAFTFDADTLASGDPDAGRPVGAEPGDAVAEAPEVEAVQPSDAADEDAWESEPAFGSTRAAAETTPAEDDTAPEERTRRSTIAAEHTVELLETLAAGEPDDFALRRRLAETRLESGDREGGLTDLEAAMIGFERAENLSDASSVADEIARLSPESVRIHQKRVEYAFRTNERTRLVGAYLDLAAALLGDGQTDKARTVYKRVLDLAPDDIAAQAGLSALTAEPDAQATPSPADEPAERDDELPAAPAAAPAAAPPPRESAPPAAPRTAAAAASADDSFVNLGDWLRDDAGPKSTRMVVEEKEPTGDEEADFAEMLRRFKQGVAENVDAEDHQSHYDLGVAFKEMGLIDEAIAEFQRALRAPSNRLPTYEALGQCFVEKGQHQVAKAILMRGLSEPDVADEQLIGVLYLLGHASEAVGQHQEALSYYQRVFVVDIEFRDVADRLTAVEQAAR